jgi:hypothetical protein
MRANRLLFLAPLAPLPGLLLAFQLASCSSTSSEPAAPTSDAQVDVVGDDASTDAAAPYCDSLSLKTTAFAAGPYGLHRGDVADDFTLPIIDGSQWSFKSSFAGCDVYVFVPDSILVADNKPQVLWTQKKDYPLLVKKSPKNVHYFFYSRSSTDAMAQTNTQTMQQNLDAYVATLPDADAAHWRDHFHVVGTRAGALSGWIGAALSSATFSTGMAIDRFQRLRGVGMFADVTRDNSTAQWPWDSNLAYAANEAAYHNAQFDILGKLAGAGGKVLPLWNGEVLQEYAETDVALPSAAEMATYDTLQIEVEMACPDPAKVEFGNCGAWDYLAGLYVRVPNDGDAGAPDATADAGLGDAGDAGAGDASADAGPPGHDIEVARFITSYHRETHWVVDASEALALLRDGGTRHFKWSFAPPWNKEPTATKLSLHFSNAHKGYAPVQIVPLFTGGTFDPNYNTGRQPMTVAVPSDARHVELWALLTGHGADKTNTCAEFCDHQHAFTVNGKTYKKEFPMAGTLDQCMPELAHGMVPDQGGTWWFGRGGWCPGKQVDPWITDLTADAPAGSNAVFTYQGLFANATPPMVDSPGNIDLTSYLVIYR